MLPTWVSRSGAGEEPSAGRRGEDEQGQRLAFPLGPPPGRRAFAQRWSCRPSSACPRPLCTLESVLAQGSWHLPRQKVLGWPVRAVWFSGRSLLQVEGRPARSPPSQTRAPGSRVRFVLVCARHQPKPLRTTFSRPFMQNGAPSEPDGEVTGWCHVRLLGPDCPRVTQCLLGRGDTRSMPRCLDKNVKVVEHVCARGHIFLLMNVNSFKTLPSTGRKDGQPEPSLLLTAGNSEG